MTGKIHSKGVSKMAVSIKKCDCLWRNTPNCEILYIIDDLFSGKALLNISHCHLIKFSHQITQKKEKETKNEGI